MQKSQIIQDLEIKLRELNAKYSSLQQNANRFDEQKQELEERVLGLNDELNEVKQQNSEFIKRIEEEEKLMNEADDNLGALQRDQRHAEMDIASLQ